MYEKHEWDSKQLRMMLADQFLLGSQTWVEEHDQALILSPGKTFYLLVEDGFIVSMFSLKGKSFGDAHTEHSYRGNGKMDVLLHFYREEIKPGTHAASRNHSMVHLLEKHGFTQTGKRGRFAYLVKQVVE